jgi:predicted ester cyclase
MLEELPMTAETNKTLIRRYLDALRHDKSEKTLDKFIAEDELKQHIAMYDVSFPGYWLEAEDIIAEGDKVAVRGLMHGDHKGKLMTIEPTGKEVAVPFFIAYRIAQDKIVQHWLLVDMPSLLQQIGVAPVPA